MKLPRPFFRLPLQFDAERLRTEIAALPESAWAEHPSDYQGNSSVRLISVDGAENDDVSGPMLPTPHLHRCAYLQQVLGSFGVVWSRSRLMRLAPGANVPEHADINYHWFRRVRVHIPLVTTPQVRFHCGGESVHMGAGEAWIFDNWRLHRVENPSSITRVHLVADTTGSASFWQLVAAGAANAMPSPIKVDFDPSRGARVLTEQHNAQPVMPPGELELLCAELAADLGASDAASNQALGQLAELLGSFCRDWRQLWALYGDSEPGRGEFARLRDAMRTHATPLTASLRATMNQVPAQRVLEGRILQHVVVVTRTAAVTAPVVGLKADPRAPTQSQLDRPVIIVAAPRSGSTLLFETLACSPQLYTVGGEGHWLIEGLESLRPGAAGIESNRLTEAQWSDALQQHAQSVLTQELRTADGRHWNGSDRIRLLEKTPKNALRIPLLDRLFPGALFVHLWRDPRDNVASIIEAWRSGNWITYPKLDGWRGPPWSLLLPPGWRDLDGKPLTEIAAYQWRVANEIMLDDLRRLPAARWTTIDYADLLRDPAAVVRGLCSFAALAFDDALAARTGAPLPNARHTLTPPRAGKWETHRAQIEQVLPQVQGAWDRLRALKPFRLA
jgi:hypothetical protein